MASDAFSLSSSALISVTAVELCPRSARAVSSPNSLRSCVVAKSTHYLLFYCFEHALGKLLAEETNSSGKKNRESTHYSISSDHAIHCMRQELRSQ